MLYHLNKIAQIHGPMLPADALFAVARLFRPFEILENEPIFREGDCILGYFFIVGPTIQIKGCCIAGNSPECMMLLLTGGPAGCTVSGGPRTAAFRADPEKIEAALNKYRQLRILFRLLTTKEYLITL